MPDHLDRAILLYGQGRHEMAEEELGRALAASPNDYEVRSWLSLCLAEQGKLPEALHNAQVAVGLCPDDSLPHFAMAKALALKGRLKQAEASAHEAIRLDPYDGECFTMLASIQFAADRWDDALESTTHALRIDPEDTAAVGIRANCLRRLGRSEQAGSELAEALSVDPEDAGTHTELGWCCLQENDRARAIEHFQEALRIDPQEDEARVGILETLSAANPVYRTCLRGFFWLQTFHARHQTWLMLGICVAIWSIMRIASRVVMLRPVAVPIILGCLLFWMLLLFGRQLSHLTLRFHPLGRLALTSEERLASTWIGGFLLTFMLCMLAYLPTRAVVFFSGCLWSLAMAALAHSALQITPPQPRRWAVGLAVCLGLLGLPQVLRSLWIDCFGPLDTAEDLALKREVKMVNNAFFFAAFVWFLLAEEIAKFVQRRAQR